MNFETFKTNCEKFASRMDVTAKVRYNDLSAYGVADWWSAWFSVDAFGGDACEIAFINGGFRFTDHNGVKTDSNLDLIDCFLLAVPAIDAEREARQNVEMYNCD